MACGGRLDGAAGLIRTNLWLQRAPIAASIVGLALPAAPRPRALGPGGLVPFGMLAKETTPSDVEPVLFAVSRQRRHVGFREVGHDVLGGDPLDSGGGNFQRCAAVLALDDDAVKDVLLLVAQEGFRRPDLRAVARHDR